MIVHVSPSATVRRGRSGERDGFLITAHERLLVLAIVFAAGGLLILGRLAWLAVAAEPHRVASLRIDPRADIIDRNGAVMATSIDGWSIVLRRDALIGDQVQLARDLARLMPERDAATYLRMIRERRRNADGKDVTFSYLRRHVSVDLANAVLELGNPGVMPEREPQRLYPESMLAAHVLGMTNVEGTGLGGVERVFDAQLRGDRGKGIAPAPVALSIDLRAQAVMENELGEAMVRFQAAGAAGLILDVDTGEVIAMASFPTFNPNNWRAGGNVLPRNNVTYNNFELGSTFKPLAVAIAIETGTVTSMSRRFDATVPMVIGGYPIHDFHPQRRFLNIPETLVHSSNIATGRIAELIGEDRLKAYYRALGFADPAAVELIERSPPQWPARWGRLKTVTAAYGHGIAVSPLALANAYAAMVNGGVWRPATLRKVEPGRAVPGRRVFSEGTSARMRELLRLVVLEGSGKNADAAGFRVGGKTGTGEKVADTGGYLKNLNVSTFAAAFPMDAPRYVVIAMLDSPRGTAATGGESTAGWVAAPLVGRVITRVGPMLGVMPEPERDIDVADVRAQLWRGPTPKADGRPIPVLAPPPVPAMPPQITRAAATR